MSEPILRPEAIEALRAVSPDDEGAFFRELIDIFLADTPIRIAELRNAVDAANAGAAVRAAHSIKGSAGNFGAQNLAQLALELETLAKSSQLAAVAARFGELEQAFAAVQGALLALRNS
ncbi:MAG: Hpt domain-containing protein [Candidatus Didemnitutus sp.]|nr:Hpt domain-containing protein [Candidatus Didemnitutus sp.]